MIIVKWIVRKLFPLQTFIFLTLFSFLQATSAQSVDSLIQIYPGIGDSLNSFDRAYLGLFPEVEVFEYAMFYIRNDEKLVTKIYLSNQYSSAGLILIQNVTARDSLYSIIEKSDLENIQLVSSSWWDAKIKTKDDNIIEGELIMFDCNYVYVIAENVRADHIGEMPYRIPVSQISKIFQEENSNTFQGICVGGILGTVIGLAVGFAIGQSVDRSKPFPQFEAAGRLLMALIVGAFTGTAVGGIIGHSSSTKGEYFSFESDNDVLKLKGRIAYIIDKGLLKKQKYYDIQMQKDN